MKDKSKKSEAAKVHSHLIKDINRIRKTAEKQMRMNTLRKHQIKLLDKFLKKLIKDGRITKEELIQYLPKKKQAEIDVFKN